MQPGERDKSARNNSFLLQILVRKGPAMPKRIISSTSLHFKDWLYPQSTFIACSSFIAYCHLFTPMFFVYRYRSVSPCPFLLLLMFFARLVYAQSPDANLPATWRLNQLDGHTYKFDGESILRAILYREAGYVNFAFGFYCEANCEGQSYLLSVLIIPVHTTVTPPIVNGYFNPSVVWSANGDDLVTVNAVLELTDKGGLVLKDSDTDSAVWSAGTSGKPVDGINLTDIGNLVLFDKKDGIIWQSFDHPTDTLLRDQKLMVGMKLVPHVSKANRTGQSRCSLTLTTRGLYVAVGSKPRLSYYSIPWKLSNNGYVSITHGSLDLLPNNSASDKRRIVLNTVLNTLYLRYIRLHADGHLRAYGYDALGGSRMMGDLLPLNTCQYPKVCGPYAICSNGQCICPPPMGGVIYFNPVSFRQPELGCSPVVPLTCEGSQNQTFLEVKGVSYFNFRIDNSDVDVNGCVDACAKNCLCKAAFFKQSQDSSHGACFLPSELFSLISMDEQIHHHTVYLKVQNYVDNAVQIKYPAQKEKKTFPKRAGLGVAIAFAFLSSAAMLFVWRTMRSDKETEDDHVEEVPGIPARFSYTDLKSVTDCFSQKLGEGGYGAVFKGTLHDGTKVAVKCLDGSRHMKKSFLNEVGTIGSIHHINLVKLLGFCTERSHRLLVYEYMPKGSLDKWIFETSSRSVLEWQRRRDIILDVAKGLHYLHEQCKQKIVHLDIKPQNILLDDNLRGKVSDFGLSKLVDRENDQVVTTAVRGTPGYLAPEWLNGIVTEKVDVYSFGMVILEIILGRRVIDTRQDLGDADLLELLGRKAEEGRLVDLIKVHGNNLQLDESAVNDALRVMRIACWCLQTDFRNRPSMSTVIKVMDGVMEVKDDLEYDFTHPVFTKSEAPSTLLSPSILSGPR